MSRPLRIEFPGAICHVSLRGDGRELIFEVDNDRAALLGVVEEGMGRYDAQVLAYCLMGNHYHFVLHTRQANLSRLMRHLNGVYTKVYNPRHRKLGTCSSAASRPFWWTGMPTFWKCAVMGSSTLCVRLW